MRTIELLADILHSTGFRTKVITSDCVEVSLTTRKVSQMEVKIAIEQEFGCEMDFNYSSSINGILVHI